MYYQRRQNKYNAKTSTYDGHVYHSKKEAAFAAELDLRKKAKDIKDWERQPRVEIRVYDHHICHYTLDFKIVHNDDSEELVEVKGFETRDWRLKWKVFEAVWSHEHPEVTLTVVK